MMQSMPTFEVGGLEWAVNPMGFDEQFEVECILFNALGPAAGAALSALADGAAPALIEVLRETTGKGAAFDLAKLLGEEESTNRLHEHWLAALDMARKAKRRAEVDTVSEAMPGSLPEWQAVTAALDVLTAEEDGDPVNVDFADPRLLTPWGDLIAIACEGVLASLHMGKPADFAALVPIGGDKAVAAHWHALIAASVGEVMQAAMTTDRGGGLLQRILSIDTSDPRIAKVWEIVLDAAGPAFGDMLSQALRVLAGRLSHQDVKRLFELAVLSNKLMVKRGAALAYVTTYEGLQKLLPHDPRLKWALLGKAIKVTYGGLSSSEAVGGGDA